MTDTKILSVDEILAAPDLEEKTVPVPEWGGSVKVKGFTKAKQQELRKQATVGGELDEQRLEMLMFVHGVSEPQFSLDQVEQLRDKAAGPIDRILKEILEVSGMNPEAVKQAERSFRPES